MRRSYANRALAWFVLLFAATSAHAQAYQCRMPQQLRVPNVTPDGPVRKMAVTGYTLAISWSPDFCRGREGQARHATQCSGSNGRFGLVVHGLWPEGRGSWPQWCPSPNRLTAAEARKNLCMMPSVSLIAKQWAKHGSCAARRPEGYFKATRILWESLRLPDYDRVSRKRELTAGDIRKALADANPGIEPAHIGVRLDAGGWFEEIKICYNRRFRPARCDRRRYGAGDAVAAKIWRGL